MSEKEKVIKDLKKIVPNYVQFLIKNMPQIVLSHLKYGNDEYIGPEVHSIRLNHDMLDSWEPTFKLMGLYVQQYSSGNVRFRIQNKNDSDSPIGLAINLYFQEYEKVTELAKKYILSENIYNDLQKLRKIVLNTDIKQKYINDSEFVSNFDAQAMKDVLENLEKNMKESDSEYYKNDILDYISKIKDDSFEKKRDVFRCLFNIGNIYCKKYYDQLFNYEQI